MINEQPKDYAERDPVDQENIKDLEYRDTVKLLYYMIATAGVIYCVYLLA